eukprot:CAMPEP_0206022682 /NCGR_PEP_ID=MMETSP1464-20131121/35128_1 /ASSEMBLY_ACC=CAM_ASM_001124 /TAXON_ID=119497 /ORGANISM="Exanthemachrysis gayraliae, Strain RCC1523" /LENGTH=44 /DNA_ID= /DNA_START= /DNA_END= /DNA_ORIENTATION=
MRNHKRNVWWLARRGRVPRRTQEPLPAGVGARVGGANVPAEPGA